VAVCGDGAPEEGVLSLHAVPPRYGIDLSLHLGDKSVGDPMARMASAEGREFYRSSSAAWGVANAATGADPEAVATAVANTTAFYAPDPEELA